MKTSLKFIQDVGIFPSKVQKGSKRGRRPFSVEKTEKAKFSRKQEADEQSPSDYDEKLKKQNKFKSAETRYNRKNEKVMLDSICAFLTENSI